jgi:hypothetical protein
MNTFELPSEEGKPRAIGDFKILLHSSPPLIKEQVVENTDRYISTQPGKYRIEYKDAITGEGYLNIYVCHLEKGDYILHIFGKIRGTEFRKEKLIKGKTENNFNILYHKTRYVLIQSRNILKSYYNSANLKSLEEHLMAFLVPA